MGTKRPPPDSASLVEALDGANHGVWDWHIPSGEVFFSDGWMWMLGYAPGELEGTLQDWETRVHPEDLPEARWLLERHFSGETSFYVCEHRLRCKDGVFRWILAQGKVVERAEDGAPVRIIGTHTDLSQRRDIEESLKKHQLLLLEAQEVGRLGHWSFELESGQIAWSPLVFEIFGRDPALGPPSFDEYKASIPAEDQPLVLGSIQGAMGQNSVSEFRHRVTTAQGEIRHVLCRCRRSCDARGVPRSMLGTVVDVTESHLTMRELELATTRAERALQTKANFLATMSHEIRTPLNGIIGLLELLAQTRLDEEQLDYTTSARVASKALLALLNDVLEFSRAEAGKTAPAEDPFSPYVVVESAAQLIALQAQQKGVLVFCDVDDNVPEKLVGDEPRLLQIALNLATNAIKFTSKGEVQLLLGGELLPDERFLLRLRVVDSGTGIPEEQLASLFEPYASMSTSPQGPGFGLGLAICKRIAALLGGHFHVQSQLGVGSTFSFSVPLRVCASSTAPRPAPVRFSDPVLLLDAHQQSGAALARLLRRAGYRVTEASSVEGALPIASSVVVMDASFASEPFVARCRAEGAIGVVLLAPLSQRRIPVELGDGVVVKPVAREALLRVIGRLFNHLSGEFLREGPAEDTGSRILIVEDNPINQKVISAMIRKLGYDFTLVADGKQATEIVRKERFDIVLMDCFMPVMDGYEATRQIRTAEGPDHRHTIIALTANALEGDRERCLAAGMDDYLAKPIHCATLGLLLARHRPPPSPTSSPRSGAC